MKATGLVRKIDALGRIVIPMEIRRTHGLPDGTPMEMFDGDNGQIILRPYRPGCIVCGMPDEDALVEVHGIRICRRCARDAWREAVGTGDGGQ